MIREAIIKLCNGEDLQGGETETVFREIMDGAATPSQMGAFLTALRLKGETIEEITAAARIMREKMVKINVRTDVDIDREEINQDMPGDVIVVHEDPVIADLPVSPRVGPNLAAGVLGGLLVSPFLALPLMLWMNRSPSVRTEP